MKQLQAKHLSTVLMLILLVLTGIAYSNSFTCSWHFDDYRCIANYDYENATAASLFAFSPGRFVGFLTFWLNYNVGGYAVAGWHLVNLLIHLLNILLVYIVAVRLIRDAAARITNPQKDLAVSIIATVIAAIFAVHPIQTQAVTYIVQRLELLGTTWVLLTFIFLLNAIRSSNISRVIVWGGAAAGTMILGMFTKEIIVVAPLLAGAYYVIVLAKNWKKRVLVSGLAILGTLVGVIGVLYYCKALSFTPYPQLSMMPFARLWNDQPPAAHYYPTQVRVLLIYLRLCLFPFNQHVEYAISTNTSFFDINVMSAALIQIGIIAAACFAWRRRPMILFGLVWFYVFLAPSSSLLPNGMYEHRLYGPLLGILLALFIPLGIEILDRPARYRRALAPIALSLVAFLIVCFSFLTYNRNEVWQTELSLWEDAVKKSPDSWRANSNYGNQLMEEERYYEAYPYIERGYLLNSNMVDTAVNLGVCRYNIGDIDRSIELLEYALDLKSNVNNRHNLVVEYLCVIYLDKADKRIAVNDYAAALTCVNRALALQPANLKAKKMKTTITVKRKDQ